MDSIYNRACLSIRCLCVFSKSESPSARMVDAILFKCNWYQYCGYGQVYPAAIPGSPLAIRFYRQGRVTNFVVPIGLKTNLTINLTI